MPRIRPSNVTVEVVAPIVDDGRFPAKATIGETVAVIADVFASGHELVGAALRWRFVPSVQSSANTSRDTSTDTGTPGWRESPMTLIGNDRFSAAFVPDHLGRWEYEIIGWTDHAETWRKRTLKKVEAGVDVDLDLRFGGRLIRATSSSARSNSGAVRSDIAALDHLASQLDAGNASSLADDSWTDIFWRTVDREPTATIPAVVAVDVDPVLGRFGAWYEFFPRSPVAPESEHQTLRSAVSRLDHIASMGFDIVYLPPVHPIGTINRKGRNNSVVAEPGDVGSPWAIGSAAGGHTAVDPSLGTVADVTYFADQCAARGMQLALDIAFQCAPDHPWVTEHPQWFGRRADGSIQFAENPPKRYEDIYPLDFESADWQRLWAALADVFRFWIERGVTVFRVDNPHTKALPFWEWALATLRAEHPETIFLAEAFTRPRVMERLAKVGFNQSYTYFAWRQTNYELKEFFTDLSQRTIDHFRPNAWPTTPDILTEQMQEGGRAAFATRAILAATLSPSWGIYGPAYELCESVAVRPGSEEFLDSEKYQLRQWNVSRVDSLAPLLTRLNTIRRANAALQHLRGVWFHETDNTNLVCYSKTDPDGIGLPIVVVANLDPHHQQFGHVDLDLARIGLAYESEYDVTDLLDGASYRWRANINYVDLAPWARNAHVFAVRVNEPKVRLNKPEGGRQ